MVRYSSHRVIKDQETYMVTKQLTYPDALEQLRAAYEHEKIVLTTRISTLEVSISQLENKVKKLEKLVS